MPDTGIKDCPGCGTAPGQSRVDPPPPGRRWRLAIPPGTALISANGRPSHWAGRAAPTDVLRGVACVLARQQRIPPIPRARIVCYVRMTGNRRYDPGNYAPSAKACVDGIVDAKVLPDDSAQYMTGPDMRRGYPAHGRASSCSSSNCRRRGCCPAGPRRRPAASSASSPRGRPARTTTPTPAPTARPSSPPAAAHRGPPPSALARPATACCPTAREVTPKPCRTR